MQSLAPPLSGALRALPYAHGGTSESRRFSALSLLLSTHPEIGTTLLPAPPNQDTKVNAWTWVLSG
jgi:hypothetical protein